MTDIDLAAIRADFAPEPLPDGYYDGFEPPEDPWAGAAPPVPEEPSTSAALPVAGESSKNVAPQSAGDRESLTLDVDWDRAAIGRIIPIYMKEKVVQWDFDPVAGFAARIVEVMEVRDDLNDPEMKRMLISYVIEVVIDALTEQQKLDRTAAEIAGETWTDPRRIYRIPGHIYDSELADLDGWLRRGGAAVKVAGANRAGGRNTDQDIAKAIEAASAKTSRRTQQAVKRTGWVKAEDGRWTYVSEGNGINAAGNTDLVIGSLERSVTFRAPKGDDALDRARRGFLGYLRAFETPDAKNPGGVQNRATPIGLFGGICVSMAGLPVKHGQYIHAAKGSGKSSALEPFAASFDDEGSGAVFVASNATGTVLGDGYKRMHQAVRMVDDVIRDRASKSKDEAAEDGIDQIARICFDGPVKAARPRMKQGPGGEWVEGEVERSWPTQVVIGERLPQRGSTSGVARLFGSRFLGVNFALINDERLVDDLRAFWGLFLMKVAALRDEDLKAFLSKWKTWRAERAAEAAERLGSALGSTDEIVRRSGLLATFQAGYLLALQVLGLEGEPWVEQDMKVLERSIIEWAADSTEQHDAGTENVLNGLRTAVATSARFVLNKEPGNGQVLLGGIGEKDGEKVIYIVPKVALEALGWEASQTDRLKRSLAPHLVTEAQTTQRLYKGAQPVKAYAVKADAWGGDLPTDDDEQDTF